MSEKAADSTQEKGTAGQSGGAKKILMILVPGIIAQAALAYFLVVKMVSPPAQPVAAQAAEKAPVKHGEIYQIQDIIVNPAGSEGRRFLNVTVGFEYYDSATAAELEARDVQVRDMLISLFSSRTVEELDDLSEKEDLKREILRKVNLIVKRGKVVRVYFVNFVMQ